jgi:hypothetical protein
MSCLIVNHLYTEYNIHQISSKCDEYRLCIQKASDIIIYEINSDELKEIAKKEFFVGYFEFYNHDSIILIQLSSIIIWNFIKNEQDIIKVKELEELDAGYKIIGDNLYYLTKERILNIFNIKTKEYLKLDNLGRFDIIYQPLIKNNILLTSDFDKFYVFNIDNHYIDESSLEIGEIYRVSYNGDIIYTDNNFGQIYSYNVFNKINKKINIGIFIKILAVINNYLLYYEDKYINIYNMDTDMIENSLEYNFDIYGSCINSKYLIIHGTRTIVFEYNMVDMK